MKICAYMALCMSLPFALLAEDVETDEAATSSDEGVAATPAAQAEGFQRYKSILDRMPFGIPPPGFNPDAPGGSADTPQGAVPGSAEDAAAEAAASEVEQQILSSVTVSMLNRSPDGRIFVGFTDKSIQPPRNYMLMVGEKRDGCEWLVVDADPDNGQVKLSKDGVEATLKMGGGGDSSSGAKGKAGGAPKNAVVHQSPGAGPRFQRPYPMVNPASAKAEGEGRMSGLDIARARRQERRQRELAEAERLRLAAEQAKQDREQERKEREQERKERELAAEERKAQLAQLMQIQEELRRQREEKQQSEEERRARDMTTPQDTN